MPSLCNSTLSSSPDQDECQYWSSFSEKPFCCGNRLQVYKGKLNGKGPRGGDFSAVKVFVDQPGTETRCHQEVAKARTAAEWLARFLARTPYRPSQVRFARLQTAPMDQVSVLNKLFSHNRRRPSSGEWILLEEMVHERGTLAPFVDRHGKMYRERPMSCCSGLGAHKSVQGSSGSGFSWSFSSSSSSSSSTTHGGSLSCSLNNRELLEAFVHFSHQASGGQLVVCSLEGVQDEHGRVILKTPVIHSLHKGFGETDLGPQGVQEVMRRHACNRHCRHLTTTTITTTTTMMTTTMMGRQRSASVPHPPHHLQQHVHHHYIHHRSPSSLSFFPERRETPSAPVEEDEDVVFRGSLPSAPPYSLEDLGLHLGHLPQDDVFHPPAREMQDLDLLFHLELTAKGIPEEPPPPYTEFIEDLM